MSRPVKLHMPLKIWRLHELPCFVNSTSVSPLIKINPRRDATAFQSRPMPQTACVLLNSIAPTLTLTSLGKAFDFYEVFIDLPVPVGKNGD